MTGATMAVEPLTSHQVELFEASMPIVDQIARRRAKASRLDVDDLRQEGAIGALNAARRVLPLWERVSSRYAARSARNAMIDAERWAARRPTLPLEIEPAATAPRGTSWIDESEAVRDAVRSLPPRAALIVAMRFYAGNSTRTIATRLGWSPGRVKRTLDKALATLRADARIQELHGEAG